VSAGRGGNSPNHGKRRAGPVDMIILHYTGMPDADQALAWLCAEQSRVSAHYFVFEDGRIVQMVRENRRAWHAGAANWAGETDINSRSIGIEIANIGHEGALPPFPDAQIDAVTGLCRDITVRHAIPPHRLLAHSDVAPGRKRDPGEAFPWARLAGEGIGHWVEPERIGGGRFLAPGDEGEPVAATQALLALYGYELEISGVFDDRTGHVVTAFQRHFRPEKVDGIADASTLATLHRLLAACPEKPANTTKG
jgi:N-acetylmuramoyl-L-alanine amidase